MSATRVLRRPGAARSGIHRRATLRLPATGAPMAAPLAPLATFAAIALPALLLLPAWHLKHPLLYGLRHLETPLLIALPLFALLRGRRVLPVVSRALLLAVLLLTVWREIDYRLQRDAGYSPPARRCRPSGSISSSVTAISTKSGS